MDEDEIRNPYDVLDLPNRRHSTSGEIKVAYRRLARKHHPDMGGDPDVFAEIGHAFERLNDPIFLFDLNKWERENEPRRSTASAPPKASGPTPGQSASPKASGPTSGQSASPKASGPTSGQSASPKASGPKRSDPKRSDREPIFEFQRETFVPPAPTSDPVHEWAAEAAAHAMDPNPPAASAPSFAAPASRNEKSPLERVSWAWLRAMTSTLLLVVVGDLVAIALGDGSSSGTISLKPEEVSDWYWFTGGDAGWWRNVVTIINVPVTLAYMMLIASVLTTVWWAPRRLMGPIGWLEYLLAMVTLVAVSTVWHQQVVVQLLVGLIVGWHVVTAVRLIFGASRTDTTRARTATPA